MRQAGAARLSVYDARGRHVRTLADGFLPAGESAIAWDGRNAHGVPVSSGVYFYRLETAEQFFTRKMVLLK